MTLKSLTMLLWRRLWLPLLAAVVCGGLVFANLRAQGKLPRYRATAVVAIGGDIFYGSQDNEYAELADSMIHNFRYLAEHEIITAAVIANLGLHETPEEVADSLDLSIIDDTHLLSIEAHHAQPETAAAIANEVAEQLTTFSPSRSRNFVLKVETARPDPTPDVGSLIPVIMAGFAGLLLAGGGVLLFDFWRQPICSEQDVSQWLHLPTLLTLHPRPFARWRQGWGQPVLRGETAVWYSLFTLCQRLWQAKPDGDAPPAVVLVTAPARSGSHALVARRLAETWAAAGQPAQRVDLDTLATGADLGQRQETLAALLQARAGHTFIVQAPPPAAAVETVMMAAQADLVLLVLELFHTPYGAAQETVTYLAQNEVTIDGVVLSHWRAPAWLAALPAGGWKRPSPTPADAAPTPDAAVREGRVA